MTQTRQRPPEKGQGDTKMAMTREAMAARAATKGYTLHESVTTERLATIHPRMLNARPDRVTKKNAIYLNATREQVEQWIVGEHYISSYNLGGVGDEVIAPPTVDEQLALVILPTFKIIAVVDGQGEATDGDTAAAPCGMKYTILRPQMDSLVDDFRHLLRVEKIFERYCREGKRPSHAEAKAWLESLAWKPYPLANLLRKWGYEEPNP